MDSEESREKSSMDDSSNSNTNGRVNADDSQWNAEDLASNVSEESGDDAEESDYSSTDSDGVSEKCPICLQRFSGQEIGTPETCEHYFCLECITKWSNKTATCPVDRKSFPSILVRRDLEGEVVRIQEVVFPNQNPNPEGEQYDFDPTYCEICGLCDREDRLLLCDGCDLGYHLECLEPRLEYVPIEDWFCPRCQASHRTPEAAPSSSREASHRSVRVARTSQSIRILHSIARSTTNDLVMETSAMEELAIRRSTASSRNSARPTQQRRKPTKRRTTKPKSKSKSAKRRSSGRTASGKRPSSIRRRLLQQLRIIPPRPGQVYVGLPNCRGNATSIASSASSSTSSLSSQRFHAGITPLRLYDSYDDLESYDNSGDEEPGGEVGVAAAVRHRIALPIRTKFGRASPREIAPPASLSGRVDILGPILNRQFILHHDRNIHITRDGTLVPSLPVDAAVQFQKNSPSKKPDGPETNNNNIGARNGNSSGASSTSSSPARNVINSPERNSTSPFNNHQRQLPSIELNGYARQAPSSPNGTSSTNSTAGSSYNSSQSNNTNSSGQQVSGAAIVFDGSSAHAVPPWQSDSNSRNDNDLYSASTNIFTQICKSTGDSTPKSDDESHDKEKTNSKRAQNSKGNTDFRHNNDDDEDYNIYSDIEEVPEEEVIVEKKSRRNASQDNESEVEVGREEQRDSDSEMIIDEENAKIRRNSIEKDAQLLSRPCSNASILKPVELPPTLILGPTESSTAPAPIVAEYTLPSPDSIPLPDSPPPFEAGSTEETEPESPSQPAPFINIRSDILESIGKAKSALREEYDPSQPLDSSDEEEHSMQLTKRGSFSSVDADADEEEDVEKEDADIPIPLSPPQSQSNSLPKPVREVDDDLNSIPMPPSDDYRRPTIQFSIPTRHRLLPISSLIKRQKGVMRKEAKNGNPMSFQNEISKIFGDEKGDESGGDWSKLGDSSEEKLSLVAEIFGSDDEEGEEALPVNDNRVIGPSEGAAINEEDILKMDTDKLDETAASSIATVANSRWKTIAEPISNSEPPTEEHRTIESIANNLTKLVEEAIIEDVEEPPEIEVVAVKEAEVVVLSNLTKVKLRDNQSHYHSRRAESPSRRERESRKDKEEDIDNGTGDKSNSSLESISDEDSFDSDSPAHKNGESRPRRRRDANGKSHKRKRSHSLTSNCEEGEIVDVPEKKKKKGKKKKSKKRKKSKESRSPSVIKFTEKTIPDAQTRHSSSEELEEGTKPPVSWRKPSKSTKQRNYRDGKPKAEEKYFRENDKHRDGSPRERRDREKHPKEKSPVKEGKRERSKERTESRRSPEDSKNHSSRNKSHRWRSRSRSVSKSKKDGKQYGSPSGKKPYSSRSESRNSPLRHSRRHRRSKSPGRIAHSRSHSKSPGKYRSHSPSGKSRRRSRSDSRSRRSKRRRSLSSSSSRSISSKRSKGRRKEKFGPDDKLKKRRERDRDKDKEREKEKEKDKEKEREKLVEVRETKDKKKKRKRREKSVSPVKAIVADGDSIVVSLNFQKGKDSSSTNNTESQNKSDDTSKRKSSKSKNGRSGDKDSNKPKLLKKTVLIDLEASPIQEQNIGVSPTVIVLSDDDECAASQSKEKEALEKHAEDKNISGKVTNSDGGGANAESGERCSPYRHGVAADSTQIQPQSTCKIGDASFSASMSTSGSPDDGSNGSLMRDDSVVTSTRGSVETAHPPDEESMNSCSPSSKTTIKTKSSFQPLSPKAATSTPLPHSSPSSLPNNRNEQISTPSSVAATHKTNGQAIPVSTSMGMVGKPVIGNIPGLFPSKTSAMSGGNVSIPSPIVIPTPPTPQLRFPAMNPTLLNSNVLVSVASAIYGPLLAARQQSSAVRNIQPNQMAGNNLANVIANKNNLQGSVLLPKNQNFHTFNSRTNNISTQPTGDGDSPFSPNSSEGDDLFEPPNERGQLDSVSSSKTDKGSSANSAPTAASGHIGGSAPGAKGKNSLFDNLFGASPNKSVHNKMQDRIGKIKSSSHQKSKSHRQTVKKDVKLSEGELRLSEDVPTSAVELRVKEKFLKKLNRQERVVEEVKLSLKPHYSKKHITKDEYKEILRKAVPKICHNKSGEINPNKIKELVEAYVKKFRHSRKKE